MPAGSRTSIPIGMPMMWRISGISQPLRSGFRQRPPTLAGMTTTLWHEPPQPADPAVAPAVPRRRPPRQRRAVADALAAAAGIGLGITVSLELTAESAGSLSAPGGIA